MSNAAVIAAAFGGSLPPGISGTNDRCTVLVSNLSPDVSILLPHTNTHRDMKIHVRSIYKLLPALLQSNLLKKEESCTSSA